MLTPYNCVGGMVRRIAVVRAVCLWFAIMRPAVQEHRTVDEPVLDREDVGEVALLEQRQANLTIGEVLAKLPGEDLLAEPERNKRKDSTLALSQISTACSQRLLATRRSSTSRKSWVEHSGVTAGLRGGAAGPAERAGSATAGSRGGGAEGGTGHWREADEETEERALAAAPGLKRDPPEQVSAARYCFNRLMCSMVWCLSSGSGVAQGSIKLLWVLWRCPHSRLLGACSASC